MEFIEGKIGHPVANRRYTDTGPLLERDLAQRAGLGWIGKNTCLINPKWAPTSCWRRSCWTSSWSPTRPSRPTAAGPAQRCIEACPTGCILPDRTLDARRCISYLTIEKKGEIPPDLRPQMGELGLWLRRVPEGLPVEPALCRPPGEDTELKIPNFGRDRACCPAAGRGALIEARDFQLQVQRQPRQAR